MSWLIYVLVLVIFIVAIYRRTYEKARRKTASWAVDNGYKLVEFKKTFSFSGSRNASSFRFVVADKQDKRKTGQVNYQTSLFGASDPEIFWDENS